MARGSKSKDLSLAQVLGQFLERTLIPDLRARVESPAVKRALDDALARERAAGRTADDPIAYRERTLEQVGAAWLLDAVFVRFLEDRGFVAHRRLAGEGAVDAQERFGAAFPGLAGNTREYLLAVFREVGRLPGARELLGARNDVARRLGPSAGVAADLLRLFREELPDKSLRWRFDSDDTRVLGDLYQHLSISVQERYALKQTPDFVESFILDRTLDPAVKEFGLDGFRMIDPTCGSGHFLLGAFHRLRAMHERINPAGDPKDHAVAALGHVYGVDLNPFAVAISRFRLLVAYLVAAKIRRLHGAPTDIGLGGHVVVADSLLYGGKSPSLADAAKDNTNRQLLGGDHFLLEDPVSATVIFSQQYHAVVGNPPYIVCRDEEQKKTYRQRYPDSAQRQFALAAPFTERFFELGVRGGFVGLINSNSFMTREFGRGLVEKVLRNLDLTGVIDTSGAFIPGHGTPTVILFGRNQATRSNSVSAVLGRRGEPGMPAEPAEGLVWSSIAAHADDAAFENEFITTTQLSREVLGHHPWSLGGGGAGDLKERLETFVPVRLADLADDFGRGAQTQEDELFLLPPLSQQRWGISPEAIALEGSGDLTRNWSAAAGNDFLFPYTRHGVLPASALGRYQEVFWQQRTLSWTRAGKGFKSIRQLGYESYQYGMFYWDRYYAPLKIALAEVSTHNHFVLDRGGKVFKQTAPIIRLVAPASEADHVALLAWLNSSAVCFWMKQVCTNKGAQGNNEGFKSEAWEQFRQFGATKLKPLPVASDACATSLAARLDEVARFSESLGASDVVSSFVAGADLPTAFRDRRSRIGVLADEMVSLQEELDWRWYEHLGLLTDEERAAHAIARDAALVDGAIPAYPVGLRAFERAMVLSGESTAWFERNGYLLPTDAAMAQLSAAMQRLVAVRIEILQSNRFIGLIERPEYKRRWTKRDWDAEVRDAATTALLDAVESAVKSDVAVQSLRGLATAALRDPRTQAIAALRFPGEDDLTRALAELIEAESVAYVTAWRFTASGLEKRARWEHTWGLQRREDAGETLPEAIPVPPKYEREDYREGRYWSLRGKLDVPRERFIAYPGATTDDDPSPLYGWAGWDHRQRAEALTALYLRRKDEDGWTAERLAPLLAGLDELVPWLKQWHHAPQPGEDLGAGDAYDAFVETELHALGLTRAQVRGWRPPEKRSGRAAAKPKAAAVEAPTGEGSGEASPPKKRGRLKKTAAPDVES